MILEKLSAINHIFIKILIIIVIFIIHIYLTFIKNFKDPTVYCFLFENFLIIIDQFALLKFDNIDFQFLYIYI